MSMVSSAAALLATSTSQVIAASSDYHIRPYNHAKDEIKLQHICKNVWGGTDYLPKLAPILEKDQTCRFTCLIESSMQADEPLALANLRLMSDLPFGKECFWLEAVRVCETQRNKGLAKKLVSELIQLSRSEGKELLSCTVSNNIPMLKVFENLEVQELCRLHLLSFEKVKTFSGWSANDDSGTTAESLVEAMELEGLFDDEKKKKYESCKWSNISTIKGMNDELEKQSELGCCGYLPGLHILHGGKSKELQSSLKQSLVFKLDENELGDKSHRAIICPLVDSRISSLKSKWVCSISATSMESLEAALYIALFSNDFHSKLGTKAFLLSIDSPVLSKSAVVMKLPWDSNECIVFKKSLL